MANKHKNVAPDAETSEEDALEAIRILAAVITCDREFINILRDADPKWRAEVYKQLAPYVGYSPRRFEDMSFECDA
jgi:hypothetical protein